MRTFAIATMIALGAAACGASSVGTSVSFGADDSTCDSVELPGDVEDSSPLQAGVACLLIEIDAGNPVVVDFSLGTVEGDQIFTRYDFDGERILIVSDDRLDQFGSGSVAAATCEQLVANSSTIPDGAECEAVGHSGFIEANQ